MARVTVEDSLQHVPDQFALVHLAALRYRQLHRGSPRLVESKNKDIVTALREIATGRVAFREDVQEVIMKSRQKLVSQRLQNLAIMDDGEIEDLDNVTPLI